jgi:hypothetical protein
LSKSRKLILTLVGAFLAIVASAAVVYAASDNQNVSGVTNHSIYTFGQNVDITGTVNGDVICAGQSVEINATVNGDVLCAGQTVSVEGKINGNIRVAAQTADIKATVMKSISVAGQTVNIDKSASSGGDMAIAAQSADINGSVGRDLSAAVSSLSLSNKVGRNANLRVGQLQLNSGTSIGGNLSYKSSNSLSKSSNVNVFGKTYYSYAQPKHVSFFKSKGLLFHLFFIAAVVILGLILVAVFPQSFVNVYAISRHRFWLALLIGFLASIIVPILIIVIMFTLFGIPFAALAALMWLAAIILSAPISSFYLGGLILKREKKIPLIMLIGSVILGVLTLIPILGWLITLLAIWLGTGSLIIFVKQSYKKPKYII